jgi:hypothetical protein
MVEFKFMLPVKMTPEARQYFPISVKRTGIYGMVLGESKYGDCIRIRKLGSRTISTWSKSFWEQCSADEARHVERENVSKW